ncbi:hypothetical protein EME01_46020 [Sinorhizobium meliloti]|nr:hypothetical protein EME01_46020 [Sinorhizobium meliloti]
MAKVPAGSGLMSDLAETVGSSQSAQAFVNLLRLNFEECAALTADADEYEEGNAGSSSH